MSTTALEIGQRWIPDVNSDRTSFKPARIPDGQFLPKKRPDELVSLMRKEVPTVATILALVVLSKITRNDMSSLVPKLEETMAGLCYPPDTSLFKRNYGILPPPATNEKKIIPYLVGLNEKGEQAEPTNHFAARITIEKIKDLWQPNQPPSGKEEVIIELLQQLRQKKKKLKWIIIKACECFGVDPKDLPKVKNVKPDWTILDTPKEEFATDEGVFERLGDLSHHFEKAEAGKDIAWELRRKASAAKGDPPFDYRPIETERKPFEEDKTFEDFVSSIPFPSDEAKRIEEPWVRIQKVINLVANLNLDKLHVSPVLAQEYRIALLVYYVFANVKIPNAKRTDTTITSKREIAKLLGFIKKGATEEQAENGVKEMQIYLDYIYNDRRLDRIYDSIVKQISSNEKPGKPSPRSKPKKSSIAA